MDAFPFFAAETGVYVSATPRVDLSGTAASLGAYPSRTFAAADSDATTTFASANTCTVTIVKNATSFKRYTGATWTSGSPCTINLAAATLEGSAGTLADGDSVTVFASFLDIGTAATKNVSPAATRATAAQVPLGDDPRLVNWDMVIPLSGQRAPLTAGARASEFERTVDGMITAFVVKCDPANKPAAAHAQFDLNIVHPTTGAETSILSTIAQVSTGTSSGTGTISGSSYSYTAGTRMAIDTDQGSDGKGYYAIITFTCQ